MNKVFIIAEAGVNHNGSIALAKKLVDAAVDAGADAIKFQTFRADKLASKYAPKAAYQKIGTDHNDSQVEMLRALELSAEAHVELITYCRQRKITFLSTPFDLESIDLLKGFNLEIFKIPSGEITNLPYLRRIGSLQKRIILSTGMSDLGEIEDALNTLVEAGTSKENITVLQCNTEYPTPMEDVNLSAMVTIQDAFKVNVGYSDHTLGIEMPIAAVALGARVIEKHVTLDKSMAGPDHKASLDPSELKMMVHAIRMVESALGCGIKKPSKSEEKNKMVARKSIVAARQISKGEIFSEQNITTKRPGNGLDPMAWDDIIGMPAKRDFAEDEFIEI
jgi:N,N'-diacetyllegionaminate synthase